MRALFCPVVFLASVCLLFSGCAKQAPPTVFLDPALVPLIPADTVALAGVRMEKLQETPFWEEYVAKSRFQPLERFKKNTGLDPKRVWEIIAASDGKGTVLLLRGKFSETGLEPRLTIEGAERNAYKGYTLTGNDDFAVVFLNPSTGMAGPPAMLRQIIDRRGETNDLPATFKQRIEQIPSNNQIWFVGHLGGRLTGPSGSERMEGVWGNLAQLAQAVQYASGGINLSHGFRMNANIEATSDADARRLRDAVRALVGFARLNTPEDRRELLQVYDGVNVLNEGRMAKVDVELEPALLNEVVAFITNSPVFGGRADR